MSNEFHHTWMQGEQAPAKPVEAEAKSAEREATEKARQDEFAAGFNADEGQPQ